MRYSDLVVENYKIFIPHLYLALMQAPGGDPVGINFVKMFDTGKTRMIGMLTVKPFSSDTGALRTDSRTELLCQYRASVCRRAIKIKINRSDKEMRHNY